MKLYKSPDQQVNLINGDAITSMADLKDDSFDIAIVDPPYGASTQTNWNLPAEHDLKRFGGEWKIAGHAWDLITGADSFKLTIAYLTQVQRLVRDTGSIFIHSTYHNSGFVNVACQALGLEIINEIVWYKRNSFPNLSNRRLTASHETILWIHTGGEKNRRYRFNSDVAKKAYYPNDQLKKADRQMRTVWDIPNNKKRSEIALGKHPTQKPLAVSQRMLSIAAEEGNHLLVPFAGSGSEMISGIRANLRVTGYEIDPDYYELAKHRIEAEIEN